MLVCFTSCTHQPELAFGPVASCPSHAALLKAAAKIPLGPIVDGQSFPKDIFDNPFLPSSQVPYLPHDFCKLDSAGYHVDGCSGPDPSIWRVLKNQKFTFVFPKDLDHSAEVGSPVSKPKQACTFRFSHRPTLDEFMSSSDRYRDSNASMDSDNDKALLYREAALGTQARSWPKYPHRRSSKPTALIVPKGKAGLRLTSLDDNMSIDPHVDTVALGSSSSRVLPQSSPRDGDNDSGDDDEDNGDDLELPHTKRKARKPLKKPTKKMQGSGATATVTSRPPALHETVNEQSRKPYACTFDGCKQVCWTKGDLERHLQTKDHKEPSIPCPKGCSIMFTRRDAAKRHAKHDSCGEKKTKKSKVSA